MEGGKLKMTDVMIIGAGVSGCAIARELARYQYKTVVLERCSDICEGTSKANSGIVHAGFDSEPGSYMAKLNVEGNAMMERLSEELNFPFKRNSSLVLCFDREDMPKLERLLEKGRANQVPGVKIITGDEVRKMEPNVTKKAVAALYAPTGGIVCPFGLTIALAENAFENGTEFYTETEVTGIVKSGNGYVVETNRGSFETKVLINAAGVYADDIHNMVCEKKMKITARKGEYCLMDKTAGNIVSHTVFQLPTLYGKGVLVTPTVHGNLLTGPTAVDIEDKENTQTTAEGMEDLLRRASLSVPVISKRQIITSFTGLRAHEAGHDFIIKEAEDAPGFIDVAGMQSPGLSSAPAVGVYVADMVRKILPADAKTDFKAVRKGIPNMEEASLKEKQALIRENPAFANVICRCEGVTEGEILAAIHRPLGAKTLDAVKRRTRAGMGRCQAGFCAPKVMEILARELGCDISEITKCGGKSKFIM